MIRIQNLPGKGLSSRQIKGLIIKKLGGKCKWCGFAQSYALQIDHINGRGRKHRRQYSTHNYYLRHILHDLNTMVVIPYQLLCANCNWRKRIENHENAMLPPLDKQGKTS